METDIMMPEIVPKTELPVHPTPFYPQVSAYSQPESPGTAIARREPGNASELLKEMSKHSLYKSVAESAGRVANTYIDSLKELNSPILSTSRGVGLDVERKGNRGLKRIVFGEQERGFRVTIELR